MKKKFNKVRKLFRISSLGIGERRRIKIIRRGGGLRKASEREMIRTTRRSAYVSQGQTREASTLMVIWAWVRK